MLVEYHKTGNLFITVMMMVILLIITACGGSTTVGNPGEGLTRVDLTGTAQKGPFIEGSTITIYELNEAFNQTGTSFSTETTNNLGDYTVPVEVQSTFVELFVQGFYFDEISGDLSSAQLSLNALADLSGNDSININILTTLSSPRIRWLIKHGSTFPDARAQAEDEILTAFGIETDSVNLFEDMTTLQTGEGNAVLLAISVIILQIAHWEDDGYHIPATLSWLISEIKHDIETDGVLNDEFLCSQIEYAKILANIWKVRGNLEWRYQRWIDASIAIPSFEDYFSPITIKLLSTHRVGHVWQRPFSRRFISSLLAISPDETRVYLASGDDGVSDTLMIFETATSTIEMEIPFNREIRSLSLNPSGSRLLVIMEPNMLIPDDKTISILDTTTFTEIDSVTENEVGSGIWKAIVVASSTINDSDSDLAEKVYLLDLKNNIINILNLRTNETHDFGTIDKPSWFDNDHQIVDITITKDNETLYCLTESTMLSGQSANFFFSIRPDDPDPIFNSGMGFVNNAQKIIVSSDGLNLYFFSYESDYEGNLKIAQINFEHMDADAIPTVELDAHDIGDIAMSPDGSYLYVTTYSGYIFMIHTPTFSIYYPMCAGIGLPLSNDGIAIGPDGSKAYVLNCNNGDHDLLIYDIGVPPLIDMND